ncbi:MAG: hypothetical protein ACXWIU_05930, partial [Limisphaerales bacterium]
PKIKLERTEPRVPTAAFTLGYNHVIPAGFWSGFANDHQNRARKDFSLSPHVWGRKAKRQLRAREKLVPLVNIRG